MWLFGMRANRTGVARLALVLLSSAGLTLTAATGTATASAAKGTPLKAVLSISPTSTATGRSVTAMVAKSTLPRGDKLTKITLSWGDGSKTVTLASLRAKPAHKYSKAGKYSVRLTLTDKHKKTVHATATERIIGPLRPAPGSYSGTTSQGYGVSFYVPAARTSLVDIVIPTVYLACSPGNSQPADELTIASASISSSGSFTGAGSQSGVWQGFPAKFSYRFTGSFSGTSTLGLQNAAGTFDETVTYANGTAYTCTSSSRSWSVTRDSQPAQTAAAPPAGSYSGTTWQGYGVTFYVSSNGRSLQDISIPTIYLVCSPGGTEPPDELTIASAAISQSGAFTGSGSQTGVWKGFPATFSYTFRGNFQSLNPAGVERAAGTFEETVSYANGVAYTCTSDSRSWSATRDTQQTLTTAAPPAGSYSGTTWQGYGLTFYVSAAGTSLQDISIPTIYLVCSPGGTQPPDELTIASAAISPSGAFTGTASETGVWQGFPATFSFTFRGNFHALNSAGVERAAGTFEETVSYANGGAYTCTSDSRTWAAARDSQPAQTTAAPAAGTYSGTTWQGYGLTFSVSSDGSNLQNISIPTIYLVCSPGGAEPASELTIASAAIGSGGSFSGSDTETGVFAGQPATFSYAFTGNFHSLSPGGVERAAGTFEETVTYSNGTAFTCTSDNRTWSATFSSS
jgi:hypothetical protein